MSIFLPHDSNYERATRKMRRANKWNAWKSKVANIFFLVLGFALLFVVPGILYWIIEIGGSLVLAALVYVIVPFFLFGLGISAARNWESIRREMMKAFKDMLDILLLR